MPPERALWTAVLLRAVKDLAGVQLGGSHAARRFLPQSARGWIASLSTDEGSFVWLCENLGLNAVTVRSRLLGATPQELRSRIKRLDPEGLDVQGGGDRSRRQAAA